MFPEALPYVKEDTVSYDGKFFFNFFLRWKSLGMRLQAGLFKLPKSYKIHTIFYPYFSHFRQLLICGIYSYYNISNYRHCKYLLFLKSIFSNGINATTACQWPLTRNPEFPFAILSFWHFRKCPYENHIFVSTTKVNLGFFWVFLNFRSKYNI